MLNRTRQDVHVLSKRRIAAALTLLALAALPAAASADADAELTRITIADDIPGAAFVVAGNVADNPRPEIVISAFNLFVPGPMGSIVPPAGRVTLYKNADPGNARNGPLDTWNATSIVTEADAITLPNRPTLADVDGDDDIDVIVPGGYFFDSFIGESRGSITWWENRANGTTWLRHDVVTESPQAYHSVLLADFDGDGIDDMATVGEDAGNPSDPADDWVELQILAGNGDGTFDAPLTIADGGGALLTAYDVDGDGLLDIVSPQFFGPVAAQPFVPPFARDETVASYVWFQNHGDGSFTRHAIGIAEGPGFSIVPAGDLLGDGVTRWIATNHTNPNVAFPPFSLYPEPSVFELTPGSDPTQPWAVRTLSAPGDFPVTGGIGQAAPGAASAGDLNDDGLIDIAVAGDGSRAVYWMEQQPDGTFVTEQLADTDGYGQNGGPVILDFNNSGTNEVAFGSYDQNTLALWVQ